MNHCIGRVAGAFAVAASAIALCSCLGTAGGETFDFEAHGAGPSDAVAGSPYAFRSGRGFDVELTRANLWIGAVYLNKSVSTSVSSDTSCALAGIYVAEITTGRFIDVLSPTPQPFPELGQTTTEHASTAELWLSSGDVDANSDVTVILDVAGTATRDGITYPFDGMVTIGDNRRETPSDPAAPGAKPICKERVVSPIPVSARARPGDDLLIVVDPRGFFSNVDFASLEKVGDDPLRYRFRDDNGDQPSRNLYGGLRAGAGTYALQWTPDIP